MIALRITGKAGPADPGMRGHRGKIAPLRRQGPVRCGECPACLSDLANIAPCYRRPA